MNALRAVLFYPLLYLRRPMLWIVRILGALFFFGALVTGCLYLGDDEAKLTVWPVIAQLVLSFLCFLFAQFYDQLLLKLNPTGNVLILEQ